MSVPWLKRALLVSILLAAVSPGLSQEPETETEVPSETQGWASRVGAQTAFVADGALAALRLDPSPGAPIKQRLRVGRRVQVLRTTRTAGNVRYSWVAVTRRTRGWIDSRALVQPKKPGDDDRLLGVLSAEGNGYERLRLCRLFLDVFPRSKAVPRVLLALGRTADEEAETLTKRADRRVREAVASGNADARTYFENDPGLDRYNRLRVGFRYDEAASTYRYDGWAYRRLISRYPKSDEAEAARRRLSPPLPSVPSERPSNLPR